MFFGPAFPPSPIFRQVGIHHALEMGPQLAEERFLEAGRMQRVGQIRMSRDEGWEIQGPQGLSFT